MGCPQGNQIKKNRCPPGYLYYKTCYNVLHRLFKITFKKSQGASRENDTEEEHSSRW